MRRDATLATQTSKFHDVFWLVNSGPTAMSNAPGIGVVTQVRGTPEGLITGMAIDSAMPPYWEYDYRIDGTSGLLLTDVVVRDTQVAGSSEPVFDRIEFADFAVGFTDGTSEAFSISRALANPDSRFSAAERGTAGNDPLYQRGLCLQLVDNVLAARGGTCNVTLEISIVFRGAMNDFDPGGVPVALILWPELLYKWDRDGATKMVNRFRGSVKATMNHYMYSGHSGAGVHHTSGTVPEENIASFFTDSNATAMHRQHRPVAATILPFTLGSYGNRPFGWSQIFDYVKLNIQREREIVAAYGPNAGTKYRAGSTPRELPYAWPGPGTYPFIFCPKADRQGAYDNIHAHAKMPSNDQPCDNLQIHAPFCGHSCVHMHWRWTFFSSASAERDGWKYKGWSNPVGGTPQASSVDNAPNVPPNQHVVVALCAPGATRFDDDHVVNPASTTALPARQKMIYYSAVIYNPNAGEAQVIMNHGLGWAYRYALPSESDPVDALTDILGDALPWTGTPTQAQMAAFFEQSVYPTFRYVGGLTNLTFDCTQQVPDGSHDTIVQPPWPLPAHPVIPMEDL